VSREDFIAVASRLFALYIFIMLLRWAGSAYSALLENTGMTETVVVLSAILVPTMVISLLLWFFPLSIARKLLPVMKAPAQRAQLSSPTSMELALAVLGFFVLASAIPNAVYWSFLAYLLPRASGGVGVFTPSQIADSIASAIELVIGLWLVLGHRGLANALHVLRHGRTS
jgi:hypothetical protein